MAFLHKDSKSLIEADLLMNLPPNEQVNGEIYRDTVADPMAVCEIVLTESSSRLFRFWAFFLGPPEIHS